MLRVVEDAQWADASSVDLVRFPGEAGEDD
jgi:predicted ATPase